MFRRSKNENFQWIGRYRIIKPCIKQVALLSRILPGVEIEKKEENKTKKFITALNRKSKRRNPKSRHSREICTQCKTRTRKKNKNTIAQLFSQNLYELYVKKKKRVKEKGHHK